MSKFEAKEEATVAAALITASIIESAESVKHVHMWKAILCVIDNAQHESKSDYSIFTHALADQLKLFIDSTEESRKMRVDAALEFREIATTAFTGGMKLSREGRNMVELRESAAEVQKHMIGLPALSAEMTGFDTASEILLRDAKQTVHHTANYVEQRQAAEAVTVLMMDHINKTGCPCGKCPPSEEVEAEPVH